MSCPTADNSNSIDSPLSLPSDSQGQFTSPQNLHTTTNSVPTTGTTPNQQCNLSSPSASSLGHSPTLSPTTPTSHLPNTFSPNPNSMSNSSPNSSPMSVPSILEPEPANTITNIPSRHCTRASNPPRYLADYHCYNTASTSHSHSHTSHVTFPLSFVISYDHCIPSYKYFCYSISSTIEPKTYQ